MKQSANILFVMGGKPGDTSCLKQAIVIARESNSSLTVLDVMESLPRSARMLVTAVPPGELKDSILAKRQDQLEELLTMIKPDAVDMRVRVRFGNRAKQIASEAAGGRHDVVVKCPEKGRTDRYLSSHCICPVQLLKSDGSLVSGQSLRSLGSLRAVRDKLVGDIGIQTGTHTFAG